MTPYEKKSLIDPAHSYCDSDGFLCDLRQGIDDSCEVGPRKLLTLGDGEGWNVEKGSDRPCKRCQL